MVPLLHAQAPVDPSQVYGKAFLRTWVAPVYPEDALKEKAPGTAQIRLVVDEKGAVATSRVLDATDGRFADAAQFAVKQWVFTPAIDAGKPAKCSLDTLVVFSPDDPRPGARMPPQEQMPDLSPTTDSVLESTPDINYPDTLYDRKLSGRAHYFCDVAADGTVSNPRVTAATHVDFVIPALQAIETLKYTPRKQGDQPLPSEAEGDIHFDISRQNASGALAANMISAPDGTAPLADVTPIALADPVWPYDLRLAGKGGTATVTFTVDVNGVPKNEKVAEASDPSIGAALLAAVEMSYFSAPAVDGKSEPTELKRTISFAVPEGADAVDPLASLVAEAKAGRVPGATGLDAKLMPIFRASPVYPAALRLSGLPAGRAIIEFVIDQEGRVRLPRIVSATHPEFGWSAATAISQWVFEVPRRKGQPTEVKVQAPFQFKAPSA
ncbi:MAG TPA: TonB family protein [Opitutaceae bacterium]|nr:TonB family protein [Opitutaceae bacterium]